MWTYRNPVRIHFGVDSFDSVASLIGARDYLLVTYDEDIFTDLGKRLARQAGPATRIINNITPNPDFSSLRQSCAQMAAAKPMPEVIVAVGGGSVLDAAFVASHRFDNVVNKGEASLEGVNVLWKSDPIPQDPFVYRNDLCDDIKAKIAETFLGLKDQPSAKKFLANVKSNTFVKMTSKDYDIIRDLKKAKDARKKKKAN